MPTFTVYKQLAPTPVPGRDYFRSNLEEVGTIVAKDGKEAIEVAKIIHKVLHPLVQEHMQ